MRYLLIVVMLITVGCSGVLMPLTSGSKSPHAFVHHPEGRSVAIVWGDDARAVSAVSAILMNAGEEIVERSKLNMVLDEQRLTLANASDSDILRVGRLAGAHMVVFVETTVRPETSTRAAYVADYGAGLNNSTAYHVSVTVRGVDIESSLMVWTGNAWFDRPINNPDTGVDTAARYALARATCGEKLCH